MDIPNSLAVIFLAALIQTCFQLSVSVLTLLSGHTIGSKRSQAKLLRLTSSFVIGVGVMTMLMLSFISLVLFDIYGPNAPQIIWAVGCGILLGVAIAVWIFYYRREKGTVLWIPRGVATYLTKRTKSTKMSAEAFGLGLMSVVGELLFIVAPLIISALVLTQLPAVWQLAGIAIYTIVSMLSLIIVWVLIGSGHTLGRIQKWREDNKHFMQFVAGAGLIILSFFVYASEIIVNVAGKA